MTCPHTNIMFGGLQAQSVTNGRVNGQWCVDCGSFKPTPESDWVKPINYSNIATLGALIEQAVQERTVHLENQLTIERAKR